MAVVPRRASPSEPTTIDGRARAVREMPAGALYTGTIAIARDTLRDATGQLALDAAQLDAVSDAQLAGAQQRVLRAGLSDDAAPVVADYYRATGRYPDLSTVDPAALDPALTGGVLGAISPNTWIAIGGIALALVLLLTRGKK